MTKKDYAVLAGALKEAKPDSPESVEGWKRVVSEILFALSKENPRFEPIKFLAAVGIK